MSHSEAGHRGGRARPPRPERRQGARRHSDRREPGRRSAGSDNSMPPAPSSNPSLSSLPDSVDTSASYPGPPPQTPAEVGPTEGRRSAAARARSDQRRASSHRSAKGARPSHDSAQPAREARRARQVRDEAPVGVPSAWRNTWFVLTGIGLVLLTINLLAPTLEPTLGITLPSGVRIAGAVALMTAYSWGAMHRTDNLPALAAGIAAVASTAILLTNIDWLLAGLSVAMTVITTVFAVLVTRPAVTFAEVVREVLIACAVAAGGALAVSAIGATVDPMRFSYIALAFALVWILTLVNGLGAGLHGLGKRGLVMILVGTLILAVALAYGEALRRWGSPGLLLTIDSMRTRLLTTMLAVPHPLAAVLGFPALAWGVFMRARRRQGWWACAFGVAATVAVAGMFQGGLEPWKAALGVVYTLVLGLIVGFAVIRIDLYFTGSRGSRARHDEEEHAVRPEPARTQRLR